METRAIARGLALVVLAGVLLTGCWTGPPPSTAVPGAMLLLAIPVDSPSVPLRDPACRRALFEAVDRQAIAGQFAEGGEWIPAFSLSPPGLASNDSDYRQLPDGRGRGDLDAARSDLVSCGHAEGFAMRLDARPGAAASLAVVQESLARVGIEARDAGNESADALLLVVRAKEPGVLGFFGPLVREGAAGDLGLAVLEPLLTEDLAGDPGMEREQGRMIDRILLSTLRYLPLVAQQMPTPGSGGR